MYAFPKELHDISSNYVQTNSRKKLSFFFLRAWRKMIFVIVSDVIRAIKFRKRKKKINHNFNVSLLIKCSNRDCKYFY